MTKDLLCRNETIRRREQSKIIEENSSIHINTYFMTAVKPAVRPLLPTLLYNRTTAKSLPLPIAREHEQQMAKGRSKDSTALYPHLEKFDLRRREFYLRQRINTDVLNIADNLCCHVCEVCTQNRHGLTRTQNFP